MNELEAKFNEFDRDNPQVWNLFVTFANVLVGRGYSMLSSKLIFERIRWETAIQTKDADFKLNNNFTAYYARKWNRLNPHLPQFALRVTKGQQMLDLP